MKRKLFRIPGLVLAAGLGLAACEPAPPPVYGGAVVEAEVASLGAHHQDRGGLLAAPVAAGPLAGLQGGQQAPGQRPLRFFK